MFSASGSVFCREPSDEANEKTKPKACIVRSARSSRTSSGARVIAQVVAGALLVSVLSISNTSSAQETSDATTTAQALFDEGRALMDMNRPAEACPKFEESNRVDPSAGTLLNLGKCYDALGRTASAYASYKFAITVGDATGKARQVTAAEDFIRELEPRLSKLTIDVAASVPGLVVRRVDLHVPPTTVVVSDAEQHVATPLDPGEYRIEAAAPRYKPWSKIVVVGARDASEVVTVPALVPERVEAPQKPKPPFMTPMRIAGIASGGAGALLIGIGAALGGITLSEASEAQTDPKLCPHKKCSVQGEAFVESARAKGVASTATLTIGGVALAAGAALFALSFRDTSASSKSKQSSTASLSKTLFVMPLVLPGASIAAPPAVGVTLGGSL